VVTEGVEDEATWTLLGVLGADYAQGYYMSRPVPADAIVMPLIHWSDRLSVNVPELDEEHRQLVFLVNQLHAAMNSGVAAEALGDILSGMLAYTRMHFATEERLMLQHGYADYVTHKSAHEELMRRTADIHRRFLQGETIVTLRLAQFLSDWLSRHIQGMDKELGSALTSKDLAYQISALPV
jgi:hemerythrin